MCVCACVCIRICVHACVWVFVCRCVHVCVRILILLFTLYVISFWYHVTINVGEILYLPLPLKEVPGCCIITGLEVEVGVGTEDERLLLLQAQASISGGWGGTCPHFSAWGDSIGIVPPLFSSEKLRGVQPDSPLLSLKSCYIRLVARQ